MFTFKDHSKNLKSKVAGRTNILKALTGSTWGNEKETLLTTYSAISKSLLNDCAPTYLDPPPPLSDTH